MLTGIDFSFGGGVTAAQIKAAGYEFVARYLSGGNSKDISAAEVANYKAAGIPVVFVWETDGQEYTEASGGLAALAAEAELALVGAAGATVFFAQDVPVASGTDPVAYMRGVNAVIGLERSGGYGDYSVIKALFDAGVVKYGWQTSGGSGGAWDSRALLRQVGYGRTVGPATVDVDQAAYWASAAILTAADDFGQHPRPSAAPTPTPTPTPTPAPTPVPPSKPALGSHSVKATLVRVTGTPAVYWWNGASLWHVPDPAVYSFIKAAGGLGSIQDITAAQLALLGTVVS